MSEADSKTHQLIQMMRDVIATGGEPPAKAAMLDDVDAWLAANAEQRANKKRPPSGPLFVTVWGGGGNSKMVERVEQRGWSTGEHTITRTMVLRDSPEANAGNPLTRSPVEEDGA